MRASFLLIAIAAWVLSVAPANAGYEAARDAISRKDGEAALREARDGADKGDPRAQRLLGQIFQRGIGTAKDDKEAARWFRAAAEKGDAIGQYELASALSGGRGIAKDPLEAARWYRKAADQGLAVAQLVIGLHYMDGRDGVPKDLVEAASWVRKAASQGRAEAQMLMAVLLFEGSGVTRDPVEGYMWISLAAKAKEPKAAEMKRNMGKELTPEQRKEGDRLAKAWRPGEAGAQAAATPQPPPKAESREPRMTGTGTGFIVSADGHVVTNDHVVRGCKALRVRRLDETVGPAKVVSASRSDDLALLKAEINADAVAPFRSGKDIREGDSVVAFGFPLSGILASSGNLTIGNVSALSGLRNDGRFLQVSTPIQPGNSGGPLLDLNGRVVGITTASISTLGASKAAGGAMPQNVNFAIKGDVAVAFLEKHGISVSPSGGSSRALKAADVGTRAKRFTVRVECLA